MAVPCTHQRNHLTSLLALAITLSTLTRAQDSAPGNLTLTFTSADAATCAAPFAGDSSTLTFTAADLNPELACFDLARLAANPGHNTTSQSPATNNNRPASASGAVPWTSRTENFDTYDPDTLYTQIYIQQPEGTPEGGDNGPRTRATRRIDFFPAADCEGAYTDLERVKYARDCDAGDDGEKGACREVEEGVRCFCVSRNPDVGEEGCRDWERYERAENQREVGRAEGESGVGVVRASVGGLVAVAGAVVGLGWV